VIRKHQSNDSSVTQPDYPVAPEEKSGDKRLFASAEGRGEGRGSLREGAAAVRIEGLSERAAACRFGIDPLTMSKMMRSPVPPR
jgi:hypothetical protein